MGSSIPYFDDMEGEFEARLRRNTTITRTSKSEGRELTVSNPLAIVEARFSYRVLDRLYSPSFIGIERAVDGAKKYVIYEVVGVNPTHYQLPGVDPSMPTVLRKEYLETINESWGKSQETWIDLAAVPTSYIADVTGGGLNFVRSPYAPLPGSRAYLLSKDAVKKFLCEEDGEAIGTMQGFNLPFTVSMDDLVRYHCGFFAFTGSGKSNLTSWLIRRAMKRDAGLTVTVIDIAGEYAVHLLDLLESDSKVMTSESMESEEEFFSSQAIPESLEEAVGRERIERALAGVYRRGVERLSLQEDGGIDLAHVQELLESTVSGGKTGSTAAKITLARLTSEFFERRRLGRSTKITELDAESQDKLRSMLQELHDSVNEKSGLYSEVGLLLDLLKTGGEGEEKVSRLTPEKLAENLASGKAARLNILYVPDPIEARIAVSRLIDRLLFLKKKFGNRQRVLVVLDEAQEYIPDNPVDRLYTTHSNYAVEQLLRQGRKYRLHCWLATQRVAHLNVNALQQLHSYFVSTLPRMYDRMVIADAFALPYEVLERSAQLETGQWIFVSFKATKQRGVPVFLTTENNEDHLTRYIAESTSRTLRGQR